MSGDFDLIFVFVGLFVFGIFIFKRELLTQRESFSVILGISILLFLAGLAFHFTVIGRGSASDALLTPLLSLLAFRLLRKLFIMRFEHEPRDTFFDWNTGLGWDRLFNIVYVALTYCLLMLSFIGTDLLAKAGW